MGLFSKIPGRSLWAEFKAFAFKGNMIDLAIAVVIGAAFSGVINSLVKDIIMPMVSYVVTAANEAKTQVSHAADKVVSTVSPSTTQSTTQGATQPATQEAKAEPPAPAPPPPAAAPPSKPPEDKAVDFDWKIGRIQIGRFIAELLNFVIVAFAVFITMVKVLGSVMKRVAPPPPAGEPTTKECPYCLSVIPYKATKCAHCASEVPVPPATPPAV